MRSSINDKMVSPNSFQQRFHSIAHYDKFLIWPCSLDCKESLHYIINMSCTSRIKPPLIVRNFNQIWFEACIGVRITFLFKLSLASRTILLKMTILITEVIFINFRSLVLNLRIGIVGLWWSFSFISCFLSF